MYGQNPKALAGSISKKIGTMKPLPDWIMNGAIVSLQGGQQFIDDKYKYLKEAKVPMVALWMQDWVGLANLNEGQRLLWNW